MTPPIHLTPETWPELVDRAHDAGVLHLADLLAITMTALRAEAVFARALAAAAGPHATEREAAVALLEAVRAEVGAA